MTYESQLQKLRLHYRKFGNLPTYDRMREIFGCKSRSTAYYAINRLIASGFLRRNKQKLTPGPRFDVRRTPDSSGEIALFYSVKAGFPGPAEEEANDRLSLDAFLVEHPNSTVFVRVKDDSMNGMGILSGDIAIVERRGEARIGQTIVVNLEGQLALKTLKKQGAYFFLESANPKYPLLPLEDRVASDMVGVVKGIARKL